MIDSIYPFDQILKACTKQTIESQEIEFNKTLSSKLGTVYAMIYNPKDPKSWSLAKNVIDYKKFEKAYSTLLNINPSLNKVN